MPIFSNIDDRYDGFLSDESRSSGFASKICFPRTEEEVVLAIKTAANCGERITTQGALTGLAAAAVPYGGVIVNTSRMDRIISLRFDQPLNSFLITVQPGISLAQLNQIIEKKEFPYNDWDSLSSETSILLQPGEWFFAPDPTETSATIGGMAACNASGAKTFSYGAMRHHVYGLRIVLSDGGIVSAVRGEYTATKRALEFVTEAGKVCRVKLPDYSTPPHVKSAAGYYAQDNMDLLDLIVGSEGTLGVITEITLRLSRRPIHSMGVMVFTENQGKALDFIHALRGEMKNDSPEAISQKPLAIEFFDEHAIALLRNQQRDNNAFSQLQPLKNEYNTAVYAEFGFENEDKQWQTLESIAVILDSLGCDTENTWVGLDQQQREKLRLFRHACPECVNLKVDQNKKAFPGITKLGTDMSVPDKYLNKVMDMYDDDLMHLGIEYAVFGHIGQNHLHVNVLPKNMDEYAIAKEQYLKWAKQIVAMGGSVAAEHGIGKLKTTFLEIMYGPEEIEQMRQVKRVFDPSEILNIGNIFVETE